MKKAAYNIRFILAIPFILILDAAFLIALTGIYIVTLLETLSHKESWEETKEVAIKIFD